MRGGIYSDMTQALQGRQAKNLQEICFIDYMLDTKEIINE